MRCEAWLTHSKHERFFVGVTPSPRWCLAHHVPSPQGPGSHLDRFAQDKTLTSNIRGALYILKLEPLQQSRRTLFGRDALGEKIDFG